MAITRRASGGTSVFHPDTAGAAEAPPSAAVDFYRDIVRRVAGQPGCERAVIWWLTDSGEVREVSHPEPSAAPIAASDPEERLRADVIEALLEAPRAIDLGDSGLPEGIRGLARRAGVSACVALRPRTGEALAILATGDASDAPGAVRPRTLAALDSWARRLVVPIGGVLAERALTGLDDQLQQLDRLSTLGGLLADVVHELRNPLVAVKTFLQLLPERLDEPGFLEEYQPLVAEELLRLERLLDTVMRHARPSPPAPVPSEAEATRDCVDSVLRLLGTRARHSEVSLTASFEAGLPAVRLGEDALRQVVLNLCLNALAVTPSGGRIEVSVRSSGDGIRLMVDDSGPGVPASLRRRIFESFETSRRDTPGGLGLAITRRIVREAGGDLTIQDAPMGGARFTVSLPAPSAATRAAGSAPRSSPAPTAQP